MRGDRRVAGLPGIAGLLVTLVVVVWFVVGRERDPGAVPAVGIAGPASGEAAAPATANEPGRRAGRAAAATTEDSSPPDAGSGARGSDAARASGAWSRGSVLDREGRPAWMATVFITSQTGDGRARVVGTGRDGAFDLAITTPVRVMAWDSSEGVSDWVEAAPGAAPPVLRLGDGGAVTGVVRASDAATPVAGAGVQLLVSRGGTQGPVVAPPSDTTTTGPDGRYEFRNVPFGLDVSVCVTDVGAWAPVPGDEDPGRTPRERDASRAAGRTHRFQRPGETWVRDLVAVAQPGARFRFEFAFPPGSEAPREVVADWTWTRGRYPLEERTTTALDPVRPAIERFLRADRHTVQFRARGVVAVTREFDVTGGEGPQTVGIDFAAAPRARVLARIFGRDGELPPDAGRAVVARCEPGGESARFDVTGGVADLSAWLNELPVGPGRLVALGVAGDGLFAHDSDLDIPDLRVALTALRERLASRPDEDIVLDVPAGPAVEVTLRVTTGGQPAEDVELDAGDEPALAATVLRTDARGEVRLRFAHPPDGGVWLRARHPWSGDWWWEPETVSPGGSQDGKGVRTVAGRRVAEMTVVASRVAECELTDPAGRPLPGVSLWGVDSPDGRPVETDARGRFRVAMPADAASIDARAEGFVSAEVPLAPNGAVTRIVAWRKRGLFVVLSGLPPDAEAAEVSATAGDGTWRDTEGAPVAPGSSEVSVGIQAPRRPLRLNALARSGKPGSWWTGAATASADDDRVEIRLALAAADELAVAFVRPDGSVVSGRRAVIIGEGVKMTDAAGIARVAVPRGAPRKVGFHVDGHVCEPRFLEVAGPFVEPIRVTARPSVHLRLVHRSPRDRAAALTHLRVVREDDSSVPAEVDSWGRDVEGLSETVRLQIDGGVARGRLEFLCDGVPYSVPVTPGSAVSPVELEVE